MSFVVPGDKALDVIRSATESVLIVAPYIKTTAMARLVEAIPDSVQSFSCITRWLPEDIASGVCDLGILEQVTGRNGTLFVHPHLHAKYYRADDRCLVGSANLTKRGLGWSSPSNVELLVELPATFADLTEWEAALLNSAIQADAALRDRIAQKAEELKSKGDHPKVPEVEGDEEESSAAQFWIPLCPVPENLWNVYQGAGEDSMVTTAFQAAKRDLAALSPPSGLNHSLFNKYVAGILRQMPLMAEIDELAAHGLTDAQAHSFLSDNLGDQLTYPPQDTWRVLKDWLTYFYPETYRREVGQEVLVKGAEISSS